MTLQQLSGQLPHNVRTASAFWVTEYVSKLQDLLFVVSLQRLGERLYIDIATASKQSQWVKHIAAQRWHALGKGKGKRRFV